MLASLDGSVPLSVYHVSATPEPVLSLRLNQDEYDKLRKALSDSGGWHEVDSEDATVAIDLADVVYVRLDTESGRVGF